MPRTLRGYEGGCTAPQSTVITDQSGGDHATDRETTESRSRENGLSTKSLTQAPEPDPRSHDLVSFTSS